MYKVQKAGFRIESKSRSDAYQQVEPKMHPVTTIQLKVLKLLGLLKDLEP